MMLEETFAGNLVLKCSNMFTQMLGHQRGLSLLVDHQGTDCFLHSGTHSYCATKKKNKQSSEFYSKYCMFCSVKYKYLHFLRHQGERSEERIVWCHHTASSRLVQVNYTLGCTQSRCGAQESCCYECFLLFPACQNINATDILFFFFFYHQVNFVLFVNIIRILVQKLNPRLIQFNNSSQYRYSTRLVSGLLTVIQSLICLLDLKFNC